MQKTELLFLGGGGGWGGSGGSIGGKLSKAYKLYNKSLIFKQSLFQLVNYKKLGCRGYIKN